MLLTNTKALIGRLLATALSAVVAAALSEAVLAVPAGARVRGSDLIGGVQVKELSDDDAPDVSMASGALVSADGRVLWAREPEAERAMASTTKIMTAIVVLEHAALDDVVKVSKDAADTSESAAELTAGARYTVRSLLEAMLVKSGNDAAVALAEHVSDSEAAFVALMNEKAEELGLEHTHFANPHGLDESSHYTSAADLATMTRYAMSIDEFRRIVALPKTRLKPVSGGPGHVLENSNKLVGSFDGANGVKTGWTDDAGYCLVASARRDGVQLYAVVLGCDDESARFEEAERLLRWGFRHYGLRGLVARGASTGDVRVSDYLDITVPTAVLSTVTVPVFDCDGAVRTELALPAEVRAPVKAGEQLGTMTFVQGDRLLAQVPVVAMADVEAPGLFERAWLWIVRGWRRLTGAAVMPSPGTSATLVVEVG